MRVSRTVHGGPHWLAFEQTHSLDVVLQQQNGQVRKDTIIMKGHLKRNRMMQISAS